MSHLASTVQHPVLSGFSAYASAHVALFSLVGMLGVPMPALWWASLALIPSWLLVRWLERFKRAELAQLVGIQSVSLAGSVLGVHGRELFCLLKSLVC